MNENGFYFLDTEKDSKLGGIYEIKEKLQIILLGRSQLEKLLGKETVDVLILLKEDDGLKKILEKYSPIQPKKEYIQQPSKKQKIEGKSDSI